MDRGGQLRVVGATGLEIGAHTQHDQRRRRPSPPVPAAGDRVQGRDERPPLRLICALGEQLLELVDHQQQPRLRPRLMPIRRRGYRNPYRGGCRNPCRPARRRKRGLTRGEDEPGRIDVQPSPHRRGLGPSQQGHSQRELVQRRTGRGE